MVVDQRFKVRRFSVLYEEHLASVARYVARRLNGPDAADVVADTFLVAWRRLDEVPEPPKTLPWLYGVARHNLANHRRGDRRRQALGERLRNEWATQSRLVADEDEARGTRLAAALDGVRPADRELLLLHAWEELTPAEIAVVVDLEPAVVRNRLSRARKRFRAHLSNEGLAPFGDEGGPGSGEAPAEAEAGGGGRDVG